MDAILTFLNDPAAKVILAWIGGVLMKRNPAIPNKVIPVVNTAVAILVAVLAGMFGVQPAHASALGSLQAVAAWLTNPILYGLLTTLVATGAHSAVKNTGQLVDVARSS